MGDTHICTPLLQPGRATTGKVTSHFRSRTTSPTDKLFGLRANSRLNEIISRGPTSSAAMQRGEAATKLWLNCCATATGRTRGLA